MSEKATHIAQLVRALVDAGDTLPPLVRAAFAELQTCPTCKTAADGEFTFSPAQTLDRLAAHARARNIEGLIVDHGHGVLVVAINEDVMNVLRTLFVDIAPIPTDEVV